jgi:hypothetical protein
MRFNLFDALATVMRDFISIEFITSWPLISLYHQQSVRQVEPEYDLGGLACTFLL